LVWNSLLPPGTNAAWALPSGPVDRKLSDFFFQAEDGIRDYKVTGVQTCALPISGGEKSWEIDFIGIYQTGKPEFTLQPSDNKLRSEERRVGKECRSRMSQTQ